MAISREKKQNLVAEYVDKLQRTQAVIVSEYRGLSVKQLQELRRDLRANNSELIVTKNTLISRALREVGQPVPEELFNGPTAVTLLYDDLSAPAKTLTKFAKDTKIMVIKGGMLGQSTLNAAGVEALSELPSREQLLGQVVGVMQAPIGGFVNVLAGTIRSLMYALNARAQQLESPAEAA